MVAKRQPLRWCQTLRYLAQDETMPPRTTTAVPTIQAALPFQGLPREYLRAPPITTQPFQVSFDVDGETLPKPPDAPLNHDRHIHIDDRYVARAASSGDGDQSKFSNEQSNTKHAKSFHTKTDDGQVHLWPKSARNPNQKKTKRDRQQRANEEASAAAAAASQRNLIALASFPGSGNTWLRYLLQQATGIHNYNCISR